MLSYREFLLVLYACIYFYQFPILDPENDTCFEDIDESYDFIIVGGGSAGCVLASRLSEIRKWKVLLLEAGDEEGFEIQVPALTPHLFNSSYNWNYTSTPQKNSCLSRQGVCDQPRGKVLGGSSSINAMIYLRGTPQDYDEWEEMGNPETKGSTYTCSNNQTCLVAIGWGWKSVEKYFLLSENQTDPSFFTRYHSTDGRLSVSSNRVETKLADAFVDGAKSLGFDEIDLNGEHRLGIMKYQGTIRAGKRCSCNKAFLHPARNRKNLDVAKKATVTKIVIENKTAMGVTFNKNGKTKFVKARKEVLLSAGAFNSVQLLMISGIGPNEELKKHGIEIVEDLPVGKNFQDHPRAFIPFETEYGYCNKKFFSSQSILDFASKSDGPLTTSYGHEALALFNSTEATDGRPDIEMIFIASIPPGDKCGWISGGYPARPKSRGEVKLKSKDPYDYPLIDTNYLSDPYDLKLLKESIEYNVKIFKSDSVQNLNPKVARDLIPNCPQDLESPEFRECLAREYTESGYHPSGTCKMGANGVVDHRLKVHGIERLRVVDASIFPTLPSTNVNPIVVMVADKAADMIKEEHGEKKEIS